MTPLRRKHCIHMFKEVIDDINTVIDKVHSTKVDFAKGSVQDRVVVELDAARVSARAAIHQLEKADAKAPSKAAKYPDGGLRNRP